MSHSFKTAKIIVFEPLMLSVAVTKKVHWDS